MKLSTLFIAPLAVSVITSPAFAAKNKVPNGQPFQALEALIEANEALISENTASIENLNSEVSDLTSQLAATQANLDTLAGRVALNESDIEGLLSQVSNNTASIETLEADLANAVASTNQLRAELEAELAQLDLDLRALITTNSGLISQLNTLIADLQTQVSNNTAAINPLTTQVAGLLATVMANTNSITLIQTESTQLANNLDSLTATVNTLVNEIENVKSRVSTLESLHADLVVGSTISGSLESTDERSLSRTCNINTPSGFETENCYADYYTLYIPEETTVVIDLGSPDLDTENYRTGNFFDTYLFLHNADDLNGYIALDDDRGYGLNSQIVTTLQPGTYVVEVTAFRVYNTGLNDYQLRVQ